MEERKKKIKRHWFSVPVFFRGTVRLSEIHLKYPYNLNSNLGNMFLQ